MGPVTLKNRALTPEESRTLMESGQKLLGGYTPMVALTISRTLDPRCDEAVRRFLGVEVDRGSGEPYALSEEPLSDSWPWGI